MRHVGRWFSNIWAFQTDNAREHVFALGMLLISYGLSLVYVPAAFVVPGAILVWLAIPPTVKRSK